jgi:nucleotide-binding universal stress UspA family protein
MSALRRVHLAYDGSLHGDWTARYAFSLARSLDVPRLTVVHVDVVGDEVPSLSSRLAWLERLGRDAGVETEVVRIEGCDVFRALDRAVPSRADALLVCGTRARDRGRGLLLGTPSERLLREGGRNVLALRVLDPGSLGAPERVLVPLSENPRAAKRVLPLLELLAPRTHELLLYRAVTMTELAFRHLSAHASQELVEEALARLDAERALLAEHLELGARRIDARVEVSDDWPRSVLTAAARLRARLVVLGATERSLPRRFFLGNPTEQVLRGARTDVGIFRAAREP